MELRMKKDLWNQAKVVPRQRTPGKAAAGAVEKRAPFAANRAAMDEARTNLPSIVDRAAGGGEVVVLRWKKPLYRVGPLTILTAAERERADEKTVTELRDNWATECSRMAQMLRPILITRGGKPVAALWRAKDLVASSSDLAAVNVFREQFDKAFADHRRVLLRDFVSAMDRLLKTTLPVAMREVAEPVIAKVLRELLEAVDEEMTAEITERVVEGIVTSDRLGDLVCGLAARIED